MAKLYYIVALAMAMATAVSAQPFPSVSASETTQSVIASYKGKRITVRLRGGQELSGVVRDTTPKLAVLSELSGRDSHDAIVPLEAVDAVIVRMRP